MKPILFHRRSVEFIRGLSRPLRSEIGEALLKLQSGMTLGLPLSRPMPTVVLGAYELRLSDESGTYRIFYYVKSPHGILVFHAFSKKTQKTPEREILIGRKRLKQMLSHG